jgi:YggT family protein
MGGMMANLISVLAGIVSVYMFLICIRILLSWFPGAEFGRPFIFLRSICDPYLDWFRRFRFSKSGVIDFSPIIALAVLSLFHRFLLTWSISGRMSLGIILAMLLSAAWSIASWILGFFIIILILRLIAYMGNFNIYSPFWRFIDFIAQPVMYRIGRIFFPSRIVNYLFRIIISILALLTLAIGLWILVGLGTTLLRALPV